MTVPVTRRVHIAPQGYEDERIYLPAIELDADRVVLIAHDDEDERASECQERIASELESESIEVDAQSCDIFDMNESLRTFLNVIRSRPSDDDIKLNVSSGSKITAISGMMACMFTGVDPIYVVPDGYGEDTVSYGMDEILGLPAYPVTEPDYQLIQVLDFIQEEQVEDGSEGVLLKEIGNFLLENELPAVEGSDKEPGEGEDIYVIVRREIVEPLARRGLVTEIPIKGGTHIRTTQNGDEMLEIGRGLLTGAREA